MAGLNLSALKQIPQNPTPQAWLTIMSEPTVTTSTSATVTTPATANDNAPVATVNDNIGEQSVEKPRTNRISLTQLRNNGTSQAVTEPTPVTPTTPKTVEESASATETSVVESITESTEQATTTQESAEIESSKDTFESILTQEEAVADTVATTPETSEVIPVSVITETTEESASIMPTEEAIVSTPTPALVELPREFFPGLATMDDLEAMEWDILKLESDMHMSEIIVEKAISGELTTLESDPQSETITETAMVEESTVIAPVEDGLADLPTAPEDVIVAEMNEIVTDTVAGLPSAADEIVEEISLADMTIAPSETANTDHATAEMQEVLPETSLTEASTITSADPAPQKPTPEYVGKVKQTLSGARLGGFKYFSWKRGYVIAWIGVATVLGVSAWMFLESHPTSIQIPPAVKTSVTEAISGTKTIVSESTSQPANYSAGQDYTVIKNTKKNRKSAPVDPATPTPPPAPTDAQPLPPETQAPANPAMDPQIDPSSLPPTQPTPPVQQ